MIAELQAAELAGLFRWLRHAAAVIAIQLVLAAAAHAVPVVVGGGGKVGTDCLSVFSAEAINVPTLKPRNIRCTDGSACDEDGLANGVCLLSVAMCANSTFDSRCTKNGVESMTVKHAMDDGSDPKFDTEFQALQNRIDNDIMPPTNAVDDCANATTFRVHVKGPLKNLSGTNVCMSKAKTIRVTTISQPTVLGIRYVDTDSLMLTCVPAVTLGCDPHDFFGGTFDRIQTQIFNQSCAVGTCHDSESQQGGLLLENSSSFGNLANIDPQNGAALAAGWKRLVPFDSANSFIFQKVNGLPNKTYGARMPKGRRKLHHNLRNIIQLWIDAGAPNDTTWVSGTD